ncbi:MAG: hypothetical protein ACOYIF_00515 [Acetivibrionales bacterium]|jgi:hypothetical protein
METIVYDIVRNRLERDFNEALQVLGLIVSSIRLEDNVGLSMVIELSVNEGEGDFSCA